MHTKTSQINAALFAIMALIALVVFNLPYRYVARDGKWVGGSVGVPDILPIVDHRPVTSAGLPLTFLVRQETSQGLVDREFSAGKLIANLLFALACSASIYGFTQIRQTRLSRSRNRLRTKARFDLGIVAFLCTLPAVLLSSAALKWQYHWRLADQIARQGNCFISISLPAPIAGRVPSGVGRFFSRIRAVSLDSGSDAIVKKVVELPTLIALDLRGDDYSIDRLESLRDHAALESLGLHREDLTTESLDFLSTLPQLVQLDLSRSNVLAEHLRSIQNLREIKRLNLTHSPIRLSSLNKDLLYPDEVSRLEVSRPPLGKPDRLSVHGWKSLDQLRVYRRSTQLNAADLTLAVTDCPKLRRLDLDRFQRYALTLKNLPRLVDFGEDISDMLTYVRVQGDIPGMTWLSHLELENLPALERVQCVAYDLESIQLRRMEALNYLKLGSFVFGNRGKLRRVVVDTGRCQKLFDDLGTCEGPRRVDVEMLSLTGVSLDKFAKNSSIREVHLNITGVDLKQVRSLQPMQDLEDIRIGQCSVPESEFSWFLKTFPNLRQTQLNLYQSTSIDIESNHRLQSVINSVIEEPNRIRIVHAPRLKSGLILLDAPREIEIRDARSLSGLTVQGPWPRNAVLEGIRNLRWFAGGGQELGDETFEKLKSCGRLSELALAYTSISPEQFSALRRFRDLTVLKVPGHDINDEIVSDWRRHKHLLHLNLDDTRVDADTIRWVNRLPNLRTFSVNRVPLSARARHLLKNLGDLREIRVADTGVTPSQIIPILRHNIIEKLDITSIRLSDALIDALIDSERLHSVRIDRCRATEQQLTRLIRGHPRLQITINSDHPSLNASLTAELASDSRNRTLDQHQRMSTVPIGTFTTHQELSPSDRRIADISYYAAQRPAKVDIDLLRSRLQRSESKRRVVVDGLRQGRVDILSGLGRVASDPPVAGMDLE